MGTPKENFNYERKWTHSTSTGPFSPGFFDQYVPCRVWGYVAPGYEPVAEAFRESFDKGEDTAAQLCIYKEGILCVDLCGTGAVPELKNDKFDHDSIHPIWSTGKTHETLAIALLADRGLLDVSLPVATYWEEFASAQAGKEKILVEDVMRHESHLACLRNPDFPINHYQEDFRIGLKELQDPLKIEKLIEKAGMCNVLESVPEIKGKTRKRHYHAATRGWIVSGIIRRVDPHGRTIGKFLREEFFEKLKVLVFCGLRLEDLPHVDIHKQKNSPQSVWMWDVVSGDPFGKIMLSNFLTSFGSPGAPMLRNTVTMFDPEVAPFVNNQVVQERLISGPLIHSEFSSMTCLANARGEAKLWGMVANGGIIDGVRILSPEICAALTTRCVADYDPGFWGYKSSISCYGLHNNDECGYGSLKDDFEMSTSFKKKNGQYGWMGFNGSWASYNPEQKVSIAYVPKGGVLQWPAERLTRILDALVDVQHITPSINPPSHVPRLYEALPKEDKRENITFRRTREKRWIGPKDWGLFQRIDSRELTVYA